MAKAYRLEVVRQQRERALEEARRLLARRAETRAQAEQDLAAAAARLCEARVHLKERRSSAAALYGVVRGQDIGLEQRYLDRLAAVTERREAEREAALTRLEETRTAEQEARHAALRAQRELDVLEKDKARFLEGQRRDRERREALASDELATARHGRSTGGLPGGGTSL